MLMIKKFFTFLISVIFIFTACAPSDNAHENVKILVGGAPGATYNFYEIISYKTVKVTACTINHIDIRKNDFMQEDLKIETFQLSDSSKERITNLVQQIEKGEPIEDITVLDANEIIANVNNTLYRSTYSLYDLSNYDKNLFELVYVLEEICGK